MLSVVLPTIRVGGLDLVCQSLAAQTYTDFELILADGIKRYRAPHVTDRLSAQPFPVKHLDSGGLALSNYCRSINDAVVAADGDTILVVPDFAWFPPDAIELHARFHDEHRGERKCLMSGYQYLGLPKLHPSFTGYCPTLPFNLHDPDAQFEAAMTAEADRYELDLELGELNDVMWSLFAEPIDTETIDALPVEHTHSLFDVEWSHLFCSLKNESYDIEAFIETNGLDEDLDGSHLFQDLDWSERLKAAGWEWERLQGGELKIPNPRSKLTCKRALRPMRTNQTIAEQKLAGAPVNPGWSLRERRRQR